jgi:hypothetical protein
MIIFYPGDKKLFVWETLLLLVTLFNIFYIPVEIAFELHKDEDK